MNRQLFVLIVSLVVLVLLTGCVAYKDPAGSMYMSFAKDIEAFGMIYRDGTTIPFEVKSVPKTSIVGDVLKALVP